MPDRYAVIGNPVAHSKSPQIHAAFARQTGEDIEYGRLLAPLDGFRAAVDNFRNQGGRGLNVTLPFKLEAAALATSLSERAQLAGAANFLRFDGGETTGDNTDGAGLLRDLTRNLGFFLVGARILVAGAGGAARGVLLPLLQAGPALLGIFNRTPGRARELERAFATAAGKTRLLSGGFAGMNQQRFDLVINTTSAGISGELPALPDHVFSAAYLAYDMMYGKGDTPFMTHALQHGAVRAADGLGMLVEQAAESFFLWRGVQPETAAVLEMLRRDVEV
jgi:shikimate dehydrogenase